LREGERADLKSGILRERETEGFKIERERVSSCSETKGGGK